MRRLCLPPLLAFVTTPPSGADPVSVSPASIEIKHHRHPHSIQVLGTSADGYSVDLRDKAAFVSDDPKVAVVEGGWVKPISSGSAKITVTAEGKTFTVPVTVAL